MSYGPQGGPDELTLSFGPPNRITVIDKRTVSAANSAEVFSRAGYLMGWSAKEDTGTQTSLAKLVDGGNAAGTALGYPAPPSGQGDTQWFGPMGLPITAGLFLSILSGTMDITIWVRSATEPIPGP